MPQVYLLFATDAWEQTLLWWSCHKYFLSMLAHKQQVPMAHTIRTPQEMRKRIPLVQTNAWERSNEASALRVSKQGKRSLS
jgi:hypothetical protein